MKRVFILLLIAAATVSQAKDGKWTTAFDGHDLAGWHTAVGNWHGTGAGWTVKDGALSGTQDKPGNGGLIITNKQYSDFEVKLEMNNDFGPDSGLFLRSTEEGRGYQAMIDYHNLGNLMGIYGEGISGVQVMKSHEFQGSPDKVRLTKCPYPFPMTAEEWAKFWHHGKWNELKARIEGNPPHIQTWINGKKFMDFTDTEIRHPGKGYIGLQVHGGGNTTGQFVRYRKIKVKELNIDRHEEKQKP